MKRRDEPGSNTVASDTPATDSERKATQGAQFSSESDARPDRAKGHNTEPDSRRKGTGFLRSKSASKMNK